MKLPELVERLFSQYISGMMVIFSLPSYMIFYAYYDSGFGSPPDIVLRLLCVFNTVCGILMMLLHTGLADKKSRYDAVAVVLMDACFIMTLIMNIDYNFFGFTFYVYYNMVNIINFLLYIMLGAIPVLILKLPNSRIAYGIAGMLFTLVYSIIFTVLFKRLKYKNNHARNKIILLYYLQCNSSLIYLFCAHRFIQLNSV